MEIPPLSFSEFQRLFKESEPAISSHAASIHLKGGSVFSGVYAKSSGYEGILTAGHCARSFLRGERIIFAIAHSWHEFSVTPSVLEHVEVGCDKTGRNPPEPDLSFVVFRDSKAIEIIKSQGFQFYDLDAHVAKAKEVLENYGFPKFNWCVCGTPGEQVEVPRRYENGVRELVVTPIHFMQGNFSQHAFRNGFDYIELFLTSGIAGFPDSYEGVSGGGIWYLRFVTKDGLAYDVEPILAGICISQTTEPIIERDSPARMITGHGWFSIYRKVRDALAHKRASERET